VKRDPPRHGSGGKRPGQIAAVVLRALAAELADPGRFRRASAYARDGAVIELTVLPGELRVLVRGSRFEPYQARVWVEPTEPGNVGLALVPRRDELAAECTCPDDGADPGTFCKHAVAALLVLADEVIADPAVLDTWRAEVDTDDRPIRRRRPASRSELDEPGDGDDGVDVLVAAIAAPRPLPAPPQLARRLPVAMARHDELGDLLAGTLADALAAMR
jgi:uncharacterized Zn finger protein